MSVPFIIKTENVSTYDDGEFLYLSKTPVTHIIIINIKSEAVTSVQDMFGECVVFASN